MSKILLNLGSVTYANKAKITLAQYSIGSKVIKISEKSLGCFYGIEVDSQNYNNVRQILSKHNVPFKEATQ